MLLLVVTLTFIVLAATIKLRKSEEKILLNHSKLKRDLISSCSTCSTRVINGVPTENKRTTARNHGYIAALNYVGQQGSGAQVLLSLQCMVSSFDLPMFVPEPIFTDTKFCTFAPNETKETIRFSDVFDIDNFNDVSKALGYPLLATREEFRSLAPKDLIFVNVQSVPKLKSRTIKVLWKVGDGVKHDDLRLDYVTREQLWLISSEFGFNIVKIIQLTTYSDDLHSYIFSESELFKDILGGVSPENITLVFNIWRALWHIVNHHSQNPHKCLGVGYSSDKEQFNPSSRLLSDVDRYEKMFLDSGYNVAVMFRIERLLLYLPTLRHKDKITKWTVDKCLDEVVRVTKELQRYNKPVITLDLGKFASSSWVHRSQKMANLTTLKVESRLSSLFEGEWNIKDWEESFTKATGGIEDKGYIAALQRTLASRAECLVMIGGGSFQELAIKDYIRNHPRKEDQCIHSVCTTNVEYVFKRVKS